MVGSVTIRYISLIISFNTKSLRNYCESLERAEGIIGPEHARDLMTVLSDAEAVDTAVELIDLYTPYVVLDGESVSLPVGTQYRAYFIAIGNALLRDPATRLDWSLVRRLKMMELGPC